MGRSNTLKAAVVGTLAFGALVASAPSAEAQGRLNFTGSAEVRDQPGSMGANLLIDFLVDGTMDGPPAGTVTAIETIDGAFDPEIVVGTEGIIQDLVISSTGVVGTPVENFLVIGGYSFTLENSADGSTFGPISLFGNSAGTTANFGIFGTVTGGDFGTSERNFTGLFTAQFAGQSPEMVFNSINQGGTLPVAFSADFTVGDAQVIPEPSTYILLATGLGALGLVGLRRRAPQA